MRFSEEEVKALEENVAAEIGPLVEGLNRMRAQEAPRSPGPGRTMERSGFTVSRSRTCGRRTEGLL